MERSLVMVLRVKLFAQLRELAGASEVPVELPDGASLSDLVNALGQEAPVLREFLSSVRFAVNQRFALPDAKLGQQDEVAVISPVSGG